ncbi:hypothetical protein VW29_06630 [Devosia limi DSM 17137]|uniref:Uncharacterized protein n=1 Tax=Devosia limi DSM 17137 TaxID=1121477 RepID=A0A0F5LSM3_9HYPH|nr:hypothetical protein [Devosia limi]KKB85343.1 hypothetical protein VW29_06630 [Devosia limi DSM 17137]SHE81428.1 hypothetical protein SAMN02745223_01116 [Devosia limi DSM 17137]
MTLSLRCLSLAALVSLSFAAAPAAFAQDAMSPAGAMAPAADAMAPMMSDAELKLCLEQSAAITFPAAMQAATDACHGVHNGAMGAMGGDAMGAMGGDAMAPKQ